MLINLAIRNFALIENWSVDFTGGESAVTGETGSGKSLFVDALAFLVGDRGQRRVKREGEDTVVEGAFLADETTAGRLRELGIEPEEGLVILARRMTDRGTQARINNRVVTQSLLRDAGGLLLDIHSQNAQSLLTDRKNYRSLLDRAVGEPSIALREELRGLLREEKELERRIAELSMSPEEAEREADLLKYQIEEIDRESLNDLDEEALDREYRLLAGAADRARAVRSLIDVLRGDGDPLKYAFRAVATELDALSRADGELNATRDLCWQIEAETEALQSDLENYLDGIIVDPQRMAEIDRVFAALMRLKRKYGQTIPEILEFRESCRERLRALKNMDKTRAQLLSKKDAVRGKIEEASERLSRLRREAADSLEKRIRGELEEMAIRKLSFAVTTEMAESIGPDGADVVDFRISTNPGEPMRSISEVASGGEMSRFMLAFKLVVADLEETPSLVFDEIDTGISGRTAQVVAEKIHRFSRNHQVLVITHLPQIAALCDEHYVIRKTASEKGTVSRIEHLDREARIEEQSRLIGGVDITDLTRDSAREMIDQAESLRNNELRGE